MVGALASGIGISVPAGKVGLKRQQVVITVKCHCRCHSCCPSSAAPSAASSVLPCLSLGLCLQSSANSQRRHSLLLPIRSHFNGQQTCVLLTCQLPSGQAGRGSGRRTADSSNSCSNHAIVSVLHLFSFANALPLLTSLHLMYTPLLVSLLSLHLPLPSALFSSLSSYRHIFIHSLLNCYQNLTAG